MGAPAWPKQVRAHLGLLLPQLLLTLSLMPSSHKYRDETCLGCYSPGMCSLHGNAPGVGRQRPSYSPLPYTYLVSMAVLAVPRGSGDRGLSGRALGSGLRGRLTHEGHD